VRHLNDGTLRRIVDEPLAMTAADQAHFDGCQECMARFGGIANEARATTALLDLPGFVPDPAVALAKVNGRIKRDEAAHAPHWYERWVERSRPAMRPLRMPAIAVVLAAVLISGVAVSGVAGQLVRVFEPTKIVGVPVSPTSSLGSSVLLDYGDVKWLPSAPTAQPVADGATAHALSGLPVLMPASLPRGVVGPATYGVVSHATGSLTFDAARLSASAAKAGVRVSPMPAAINGSTLVVSGGPALIEAWGLTASGNLSQMPTLVIAQTRVPTVDSTGASAAQLEDYLLSQPGVPPDLAAQVKAIKDPSATLPIPIPKGLATTENIQVNGVQGLLIKSALGAGVVWVKNGVIYAVGGQLTSDQVVAIATSLH
jgi:Domain of unknown function (DUF4367)